MAVDDEPASPIVERFLDDAVVQVSARQDAVANFALGFVELLRYSSTACARRCSLAVSAGANGKDSKLKVRFLVVVDTNNPAR